MKNSDYNPFSFTYEEPHRPPLKERVGEAVGEIISFGSLAINSIKKIAQRKKTSDFPENVIKVDFYKRKRIKP